MTNTTKFTKLQVVEMMLADEGIVANATFKDFLENEKALLIKKRDNKKPSKAQSENVGIKDLILEVLAEKSGITVTEIQNSREELKALSNQKISALVTQLKNEGSVVKATEKGKSLFSLA